MEGTCLVQKLGRDDVGSWFKAEATKRVRDYEDLEDLARIHCLSFVACSIPLCSIQSCLCSIFSLRLLWRFQHEGSANSQYTCKPLRMTAMMKLVCSESHQPSSHQAALESIIIEITPMPNSQFGQLKKIVTVGSHMQLACFDRFRKHH